jgi:phosphate transport system ATP-binding protein
MSKILELRNLGFVYGQKTVFEKAAVNDISLSIEKGEFIGIIGHTGSGKSTLVQMLNGLIEPTSGQVFLDGEDIWRTPKEIRKVRFKVGMVFQKPNPFPKSIFENVAYGLRIHGEEDEDFIKQRVEESLKSAAIWDEVKDKLDKSAMGLSGGQQQRLCIARTIANNPEVILMDEPCSALDPISTLKIEDLIHELKKGYTIIIVTHNMQQASRVSDYTSFFLNGEIIESGRTEQIFVSPKEQKTEEYITGRFG